jgi:hypothetical protein
LLLQRAGKCSPGDPIEVNYMGKLGTYEYRTG